jgi:hypothetical protein
VGIGADEVAVELVGMRFGEELAAAGEVFQVEELLFFQAVHGFHITLVGVRGGRDTYVLTVAENGGEIAFELAAIVGPPDQIAQRNATAIEQLLNAGSEDRAGRGAALLCKCPGQEPAAHFAGGVLDGREAELLSLRPVARDVVEIFGIRADLLKGPTAL